MTARTLYAWFQEAVDRYPEHTALEVQDTSYTYRELHAQAEALAELLVREHGKAPERVALLAMRSHVAYAGYLAALRLGAVVTPLNPRFPVTRNQATCDLARIDVVLVDESGAAQVSDSEGWSEHQVITLTAADVAEAKAGGGLPAYRGDLDDVAYLLFTSGSTGRPKGVPIRHRNASAYVAHSVERYDVRPGDRVSHTFDLTFDPSVFDLFVTWAAGATLVVPQRTELLTPVDYLIGRRITHWFSVPSVVTVSRSLGKLFTGVSDTLRYSLFIGEQLTLDQAAAWRRIAPGAVIGNVYGPTELTVACAGYELPADPEQWPATSNDTVPIGPVYPFLEWLVLDEDGRPAEDGELVVRGSQRFAGYYAPEDDAGRFVSVEETPGGPVATVFDGSGELTDAHYYRTGDRVRLENGAWVHLGRLDNQVKLRGYRVELGEIETVLRRHPGIDQAVVVVSPQGPGAGLVAFHTGPEEFGRGALSTWLRKKLPVHMVPQQYEHLDALPLNTSGKADRPGLVRMLTERATRNEG
ncbi:amino acid adenylation domain-containing protein [Streptomyces telluris]|uniref:Amino acid adenylation domain-containing protein n=1 Tax=Streptomyces telluris TaxID=2720021 RepID=A0A9X2LHZ5_9ACTN|nr:amino acid adenylation domain-containing protein [Streptomyces telluris]MCQ8771831.1 amino acid adenylation domain-containing protein [Streptomyces telluris]NJP79680.1 D-alanine--poly(phosphoribitol) ligase [Streptomyces telluris]